MKSFQFVHVVLLSIIAVLAGCSKQSSDNQNPYGEAMPAAVMKPLQREVSQYDEYTGRFRASERVEVKARVSGFLQQVNFENGGQVEKGQTLFIVDQRPFRIAYQSAKANYEVTKREFERAQRLRQSNAISQEELERRQQELVIAQANFEQTNLNLEFTEVKAPISGRISRSFVDQGNLISGNDAGGTLLATIVSIQPIDFYFEGSELDVLTYVRRAQEEENTAERGKQWPVEVKLQDEDDFVHVGMIDYVANELDLSTATIEIRASFENTDEILEPGMFGRLRIAPQAPFKGILIPDRIIGSEQVRKYVYVVGEENVVNRKYLTLGTLTKDGMRVIKNGLSADDVVVTGNLQMLQPGMSINPIFNNDNL
ncbi:efflux RND transporter periplasmic adaptor subunit [Glaciecola sp. MH2013]|uniref:efflux RND transporter periplasmic adaptor subunit n=1 Tax=Glaciecola sp. MH2013 TaxID=2785524 RepID=UPI00189CDF6F|nr:efflux RND transporter periplasmic adaptor subunit [Glaciecola sp. MH2013]MBF7073590.1 efflux RND transporter periplasmic adaptor subunit [Glaciecola sp. MH2013]